MAETDEALTQKAAQVLRAGFLWPPGVRHDVIARAVLDAVLPDVAAVRPVADRGALAKTLCRFWDEDLVENDASSHSYGAPFPCPPCTAEADAILAAGVITDAADVRRQVAEEIAVAYESRASRVAAQRNHVQAVTWRAAARIAREAGDRA